MQLGHAIASRTRAGHVATIAGAARRAIRSAALPKLAEFLCQFLPGHGPVVSNAFAKLGHVAFDLKLVLFKPRDIELLSGGAPLELTSDILIIVTNDPNRAGVSDIFRRLKKKRGGGIRKD